MLGSVRRRTLYANLIVVAALADVAYGAAQLVTGYLILSYGRDLIGSTVWAVEW